MAEENNSGDRLRTLLYMIILPLLFTFIGGIVLAQTFGLINLLDYARAVPVLGERLPEPEPEDPDVIDREEELQIWAEELQQREEDVEAKEEKLEEREEAVLELEEDLTAFEEELKEWEEELDEREEGILDEEERIIELANIYEGMGARQAAEKIVELDDDLVIDMFMHMPTDAKSDILAQLDGDVAGRYSTLLAGERERVTEGALDQREADLDTREQELDDREDELDSREDRIERLANMYAQMDPEVASDIISGMMVENKDLVVQIFNEMEEGPAAEILSELPRDIAMDIITSVGGDLSDLEDEI
ncbi:hypothetical protein [Natranaerofaba carboxydovora]|uniref:hypothetical protein n=1 Tax=Natranaerofaba carboxydovora TaxID=2742683 RepID=UPI001F139036|nr:hypothetical protein [Natranaerofaba carboxydovora]UMZ73361.1 hypothetical protein ACONDI_00915 [Natranaerofaba carboxydovora]